MCPANILALVVVLAAALVAIKFNEIRKKAWGSPFTGWGKSTQFIHGKSYDMDYRQGSRNTPPSLKISQTTSCPFEFVFRREDFFDQIAKQTHLAAEIETGDQGFDDVVYSESDAPEFVRSFLRFPEVRDTILALLNLGFHEIKNAKGKISILTKGEKIPTQKDHPAVLEGLQFLSFLAQKSEVLHISDPNFHERQALSAAKTFFIGTSWVLFGLGMIGLFASAFFSTSFEKTLDADLMFRFSLRFSLPAACLFIGLALNYLVGRSSTHREMLKISMLATLGLVLSIYFGMDLWNRVQDQSAPIRHRVLVLDAQMVSGKSRTYYAITSSWRPQKQNEKFRIGYATYEMLIAGKTAMDITTKKGALNFEHMVRYEIVSAPT